MTAPLGWGPEVRGTAVVTVGTLMPDAVDAIAGAGAHVLAAVGWHAVAYALPEGAVVIASVPADIGQGELEQLAAVLDGGRRSAIVVCEADAVDVAAATLMGPGVELLCEPSPGDWVAALAWASLDTAALPAGVREGGDEGERLRRLHEAVARIAAQLVALAEPVSDRGVVADRRTRYAPAAAEPIDPAEIRRVIRGRRLRAQFFDARLLEDPGWDMLLDLFAAELERTQVSVSSLCIAAAVAPTTALRWISRMVEAGLMRRVADLGDRRRAFVALSAEAGDAMRAYVAAARKAGVGLV